MRYKIWAQIERYDEEDLEVEPENVSEAIGLRVFDDYQGAISYLAAIGAEVYDNDVEEMEVVG